MNKRMLITALPLVLVNVVAVSGQYGFIKDHTTWPVYGVAIFAAALESVALYLAYMAHASLMQNDSALRLRLAAYSFGLIAGVLNYSHYAPDGRITFVAFATGLMSASSPWLWSVYSRRASRDALMAAGLIEPHAVRLGVTRWIWHPMKSTRVMYMATWQGEQSPQAAISAYENTRPISEPVMAEPVTAEPVTVEPAEPVTVEPAEPAEPALPEPARPAKPMRRARADSKAAIVRQALNDAPGDSAPVIAARLAQRGVSVSAAYVRQVRSVAARREIETRRSTMRALASGASSGYAPGNRIQDE
jgi:hypothetical protein